MATLNDLEVLVLRLEDNLVRYNRYERIQIMDARQALDDHAPVDPFEFEELQGLAERLD